MLARSLCPPCDPEPWAGAGAGALRGSSVGGSLPSTTARSLKPKSTQGESVRGHSKRARSSNGIELLNYMLI